MMATRARRSGGPWLEFLAGGGLIVALIVLIAVVTAWIEPRFLSVQNVVNTLRNAAILAVVSMGQMLVMIAGGFDLSVGAVIAMASVASALLMGILVPAMPDMPVLAVILSAVLATGLGALVGLANGALVGVFKISPLMVTIAMGSIVAGTTFYVTKGIPVYGMPDFFMMEVGRGRIFGVPVVVLIGLAVVLLVVFVQRMTVFGRHIYAVGSDPVAARQSGIPTVRVLMAIYATSGATAAITGILLTARIGSGQSTLGTSFILESIAAAVIGGVSLIGGAGRAERVMAAALFLAVVANAMNLMRIDSKFQTLVLGVVLIAALCAEAYVRWRRRYG